MNLRSPEPVGEPLPDPVCAMTARLAIPTKRLGAWPTADRRTVVRWLRNAAAGRLSADIPAAVSVVSRMGLFSTTVSIRVTMTGGIGARSPDRRPPKKAAMATVAAAAYCHHEGPRVPEGRGDCAGLAPNAGSGGVRESRSSRASRP